MQRFVSVRARRALYAAIDQSLLKFAGARPVLRHSRRSRPMFESLEQRQLLSVNVTTYHYNNAETGANTQETALTLANVNTSTFGKIASMQTDGQIYGQPLIMTGVPMANGQGTHDIVLVATENDDVYAFDAYGNNPSQGYLWRTSLLQTGETTVPESDYGTTDILPQIGITGTPVINPATNTLYVVGAFKESNATYEQRIYALNISSGANAVAPVTISASVSGTGYDQVGNVITFSPFRENQRPALTLANGEVYVGWSSHGDEDPWHGWVIGFNASTLHEDYVYCNTANGAQGGIWMSGGGLAVDSSGNLYFTSGNGTFDANTSGGDYGMAIEEVSPALSPEQYFAPYNQAALSNADLDYGCANVILITGQSGSAPNEIISAGKWGTIYLNNTASLGGYNSNQKGPNTDLSETTLQGANTSTSNVHNTMVYWNGSVYLGGDALTLQAFSVANGSLSASPTSQTTKVFGNASDEDGQGAGLTVSSNGSSDGIVWALDNSGFLNSPAVLYAYNANNLSAAPLWTSSSAANGRDTAGIGIKFQDPVVANGHVYVAGDGSVTVYGIIQPSTSAPTLVTPAAANPSTVTGTTTTLSVQASDASGDLNPVYNWAATTLPTGANAPTFSINGTNSANNPTVTFTRAGLYTLTATITDPNSQMPITSSVTVTVSQTLTSVSISPSTVTVPDMGTQQFTGIANDQFGNPMASQPSFSYSVATGGAGGTISSTGLYTAPATGVGTDTITATDGSYTATATVTVAVPSATVQLSLAGYYNQMGIAVDGVAIPGGGIDGDGDALSGNLLGTSKTWNSSTFTIPPTDNSNAVNNVVYGTGQTIDVSPQSQYSRIKLLALHLDGNATNLVLTFNYTDGSTQSITQSFSDWYTPQNYPGESKAITMNYRDLSTGAMDNRKFYVYGYSYALTAGKTLQSITLPNDPDFDLVSVDLIGVAISVPAAASPSPVTGTTTNLSVTGVDPSGDAAVTYTWAATNVPTGAITPTFSVNGTATSNVSTATFYKAGNYTFTVTAADPTSGASATSSVNVTVQQTATSISVTPQSPAAIYNGQTQQFSATATDQFNQPFTTLPTFTWTVASGVGSIGSTGLYQAPAVGSGSVTVQAAVGTVHGQSTIHVNLPAWLGSGSAAIWNSSNHVLTVTGATSIIADPGSDQPIIEGNTSSAVVTINPATALQIHIGGLSLTNGASATVTSLGAARTATNHRVLVLGLPGTLVAPLLVIDSASKLNLTDNDLVDHDGSYAAMNGLLTSGFNAPAGYWNGNGIDSSIAAGGVLTTLGDGQPSSAGTFDNETVSTNDVEVAYTFYGDATLDGRVDGSDYSRIDNGSLNNLTGFSNGDFNYDGVIDGSDYTLLDNAFNSQGAALDTQVAAPAAAVAFKATAVATSFVPGSPAIEPVISNSDVHPASVDLLAQSIGGFVSQIKSPRPTTVTNPGLPVYLPPQRLTHFKGVSGVAAQDFSDVQILLGD